MLAHVLIFLEWKTGKMTYPNVGFIRLSIIFDGGNSSSGKGEGDI